MKTTSGPTNIFVTIRLPDHLLERIDNIAEKDDRNRSYVIRKCVEVALDKVGAGRILGKER